MCDRALFRRIDLGGIAGSKEKGTHVLHQELSCLGIHDIQAVVVDEHRLLLQPVAPADLTDLGHDALSHRTGKRGAFKAGAAGAASAASQIRHGRLGRGDGRANADQEQKDALNAYPAALTDRDRKRVGALGRP